jgi:hypothetical protein
MTSNPKLAISPLPRQFAAKEGSVGMAVDWNDLVSAFDFTGEGSDDTVFIHRKTQARNRRRISTTPRSTPSCPEDVSSISREDS